MPQLYPANAFAYLMFFLWPVVTTVFFVKKRPPLAVAFTIIVGTLLLPERLALSIPGLPPLDKHAWVNICALVGTLATSRSSFRHVSIGVWLLITLVLVSWVGSVLTNREALRYGPKLIAGLDLAALRIAVLSDVVHWCIPLVLGQALFRTLDDLRGLLRVLVAGAILYTLPMLFELRLSPQLHHWFYGFHAHEFVQAMRAGGYRPTVFLQHGLLVAKLMQEAITLALGLRGRGQKMFGRGFGVWAAWLLIMLILDKSVASLIYSLAGGAFIFLLSARRQATVAMLLLAIVATYPLTRANDWFPTDSLVQLATNKNVKDPLDDRSGSLKFRFDNEDVLIAWTLQKPYFGWGGNGRNRVYDRETGRDMTTTDGAWIIEYGTRGAIGAFFWFCVLAAPVFRLRRLIAKSRDPAELALLGSTILVLTTTWIDLLPNSGPSGYSILISGAVLGFVPGTGNRSASSLLSRLRLALARRATA